MDALRYMARLADLGLILHDECAPFRGRLFGQWEKNYRDGLYELEGICKASIEMPLTPMMQSGSGEILLLQ